MQQPTPLKSAGRHDEAEVLASQLSKLCTGIEIYKTV